MATRGSAGLCYGMRHDLPLMLLLSLTDATEGVRATTHN